MSSYTVNFDSLLIHADGIHNFRFIPFFVDSNMHIIRSTTQRRSSFDYVSRIVDIRWVYRLISS